MRYDTLRNGLVAEVGWYNIHSMNEEAYALCSFNMGPPCASATRSCMITVMTRGFIIERMDDTKGVGDPRCARLQEVVRRAREMASALQDRLRVWFPSDQ